MKKVVNIEEAKFYLKVKKGFRNWKSKFKENFGIETRLGNLSISTLAVLAKGRGESIFYIHDLIMNIRGLGSAMEFNELDPNKKLFVIDQYLFLLDQIRFECMKRLNWLKKYAAETYPLVILIRDFEKIAPFIKAEPPVLTPYFPGYEEYKNLSDFDKETFIRRLIPKMLQKIDSYSKTL